MTWTAFWLLALGASSVLGMVAVAVQRYADAKADAAVARIREADNARAAEMHKDDAGAFAAPARSKSELADILQRHADDR